MGVSTGVLVLDLPCGLTSDELMLRGNELATAQIALAKVHNEKRASAAGYKSQIEDLEMRVSKLSKVVNEKRELRPVECRLDEDRNAATMKTVRVDTEEVVSSRPMTEAERQVRLFGGPTPEQLAADGEQLAIDSQVDEVFGDQPLCEACKQPADHAIHDEPFDQKREWDKGAITGTSHAFVPPTPPEPAVAQDEVKKVH